VNCAFVGAGSVAKRYTAGLEESSLRLVAVCDRDRDRAEQLAATVGDPGVYTELSAMLAAESVPLVVNLTSHAAHANVTRTCLTADRHVFSEKPLALDAEEAADLVRLAADRELALGCAPENHRADAQRHARTLLEEGRLGPVRFVSASANVGRVTEWHDRPESFLKVGPLFDGAVYPLSLLVAWFGPVKRVRRADAPDVWPDDQGDDLTPQAPPHIEATLEFVDGPVVALRASFYVDHRSREFYGVELHGDDGTLYLDDTGALAASQDAITVRGGDRDPTVAPHPRPKRERPHLVGPERLAQTVDRGTPTRAGARRAAHVVAVCEAIETATTDGGGPVTVAGTLSATAHEPPSIRPVQTTQPDGLDRPDAIELPVVGFGCSRYRGGDKYVEPAMEAAVDAGYRLFDTAELYGNEWRLGNILTGAGGPNREAVFILGKPWRTNHGPGHLRQACVGSLAELGIESFDCYALHWPGAFVHRGELHRLSEQSITEQQQRTFPTDQNGTPIEAAHTLVEAWERLEALHDEGLTRTLGVCNVTLPQLARLVDDARIPPALVQVERHPYRPRTELVEWCHQQGIRVVAHSPLSAPELLSDSVVESVAKTAGMTPAEILLAWHIERDVVPIPSTSAATHAVSNLAAARCRLDTAMMERLDQLADPGFER